MAGSIYDVAEPKLVQSPLGKGLFSMGADMIKEAVDKEAANLKYKRDKDAANLAFNRQQHLDNVQNQRDITAANLKNNRDIAAANLQNQRDINTANLQNNRDITAANLKNQRDEDAAKRAYLRNMRLTSEQYRLNSKLEQKKINSREKIAKDKLISKENLTKLTLNIKKEKNQILQNKVGYEREVRDWKDTTSKYKDGIYDSIGAISNAFRNDEEVANEIVRVVREGETKGFFDTRKLMSLVESKKSSLSSEQIQEINKQLSPINDYVLEAKRVLNQNEQADNKLAFLQKKLKTSSYVSKWQARIKALTSQSKQLTQKVVTLLQTQNTLLDKSETMSERAYKMKAIKLTKSIKAYETKQSKINDIINKYYVGVDLLQGIDDSQFSGSMLESTSQVPDDIKIPTK